MEVKVFDKLVDLYHENKISHAYLIETNNIEKCFLDLKNCIKKIFCHQEYDETCNKCNICNLINQNYLPSLVIIEPDGNTIKKEQIINLKKAFSSLPIYTKENIYIIKNAEKLNAASANTMLKFVEEPEDHIIGFFLTNNINNIISTIRSRCEILKIKYDKNFEEINDSANESYIEVVKEYLMKIEVEKNKMIMYNKDVLLNKFTEKSDIRKIFGIILNVYERLLYNLLNSVKKSGLDDWSFLEGLNEKALLKRISLVSNFLDNIESNANVELLIDKFVIELSDNNG